MSIVFSEENDFLLNTNLSESAFGKLKIQIAENGMLAKLDAVGNQTSNDSQGTTENTESNGNPRALFEKDYTFKPWSFSNAKFNEKTETVCLVGPKFEGTPLSIILENKDSIFKARAVYAVTKCITQALRENVSLPINGASGILVSDDFAVLFLPQHLFTIAADNSSDSTQAQDLWLNKSQSVISSLMFTRSVIVYKALTGNFPFTAQDLTERQSDIQDNNYTPLRLVINGISREVASAVSVGLENSEGTAKSVLFPMEDLQKELGLQNDGTVVPVERKPTLSEKEFEKEKNIYLKSKKSKINRSRLVRRNTTFITIAAIIFALILWFAFTSYKNSKAKPTAVSLTSTQVVEGFYTGMHSMDIPLMQEMAKGKSATEVIDMVSNVYVTSSARKAYETKTDTIKPELWLYRHDLSAYWQFGITNFTIDKTPSNKFFVPPTKKQNAKPLTSENDKPINSGDKTTHLVSYDMIHSEGYESKIFVQHTDVEVELTFIKNAWKITSLKTTEADSEYDMNTFEMDYQNALLDNEGIVEAIESLKAEYPWLPTKETMLIQEKEVQERTLAVE